MFTPTIKINTKRMTEVIWMVALLGIARIFEIFTTQQMFIIITVLLVMFMGMMKKIVFPQIYGLNLYLIFLIYATILGLALYRTRKVARDFYYIAPTIILVVLGYYLYMSYRNKKSIYATIILVGTMFSTNAFIKAFMNPSGLNDFNGMRDTFDGGGYEVMIAFIALFAIMYVKKENIFGKWLQRYCFVVMLLQLVLSLTRSMWMGAIAGCFIVFLINTIKTRQIVKAIKNFCFIVVVGVACFWVLGEIAPENVTDQFFDKFAKSTEELDSEQEFDSTSAAMGNWRGYEIQMAEKQWKESSVFVELFGAGLGKGVRLEYVPYTWQGTVEDGEIPLLHNGYYTILPKGGLFGTFALLWFMLANAVRGIIIIARKKEIDTDIIVLVAISVAFALITYVIRGPVAQVANMSYALMVGWFNGKIRYEKRNISV